MWERARHRGDDDEGVFKDACLYVQGVNGSQWVIQTMLEDVSLRNDLWNQWLNNFKEILAL